MPDRWRKISFLDRGGGTGLASGARSAGRKRDQTVLESAAVRKDGETVAKTQAARGPSAAKEITCTSTSSGSPMSSIGWWSSS